MKLTDLKKHEGKNISFTFKGILHVNRKVHFVGLNNVGHKVISFMDSRGILFLNDWSDIKDIHEPTKDEMGLIFKTKI